MICVEADENDLQKLVEIGRDSVGTALEQLTNVRITEDSLIAFEVIFPERYKPNVSVRINVSKASVTSLYIDFTLGTQSQWLPDFLISGCNKIASVSDRDIASILEQKCGGALTRESSSRLSFDLQTFCRKKGLPFTVNITDVSLRRQQFTLKLELNREIRSYCG